MIPASRFHGRLNCRDQRCAVAALDVVHNIGLNFSRIRFKKSFQLSTSNLLNIVKVSDDDKVNLTCAQDFGIRRKESLAANANDFNNRCGIVAPQSIKYGLKEDAVRNSFHQDYLVRKKYPLVILTVDDVQKVSCFGKACSVQSDSVAFLILAKHT